MIVRAFRMRPMLILLLAFAFAGCDDTKDLGGESGGGGSGSGHGPVKKSHKMPEPHYKH
jgi:hypothetical protein